MSTKEDWYVKSLNEIYYVEFSQSLKVKYIWMFKRFWLLRKTLQGVASSFHVFLVVLLET